MTPYDHYPVHDIQWKSPRVFELTVPRNGLTFVPGDSVAITTVDSSNSRPYSIASGINEKLIRFLIQHLPNGEVSTALSQLKSGDHIRLSSPFGWFRPGSNVNGDPFVFIATGTGIAPFLSYLKGPNAPRPLACLYGVRYLEDALELDFLRDCCPVMLAVSREHRDGIHHGRVTDLLEKLPCHHRTHYYLCGLDAMIDEVSFRLEQSGVDFTHIHREVFFYASSES